MCLNSPRWLLLGLEASQSLDQKKFDLNIIFSELEFPFCCIFFFKSLFLHWAFFQSQILSIVTVAIFNLWPISSKVASQCWSSDCLFLLSSVRFSLSKPSQFGLGCEHCSPCVLSLEVPSLEVPLAGCLCLLFPGRSQSGARTPHHLLSVVGSSWNAFGHF